MCVTCVTLNSNVFEESLTRMTPTLFVANLGVADLLSLSELEISPGHASLELDHYGQCRCSTAACVSSASDWSLSLV